MYSTFAEVMKWTGHSDYKAMKPYIDIADDIKAIRSQYADKKGYSTRNLIYMCQFAKAYPMEVLIEMAKIEELLNSPSVDNVLQLTNEPFRSADYGKESE